MTVGDDMKKIAFTPDDLADVYAKRWMVRDMGNYFISHLKPVEKHECDRCGCEVDASDELSDGSYRCDECFTFFAELNWYDPDDRKERIEDYLKMKREDI